MSHPKHNHGVRVSCLSLLILSIFGSRPSFSGDDSSLANDSDRKGRAGSTNSEEWSDFARFVPADAGVFVRMRRVADAEAALTRTHLHELLALPTGGASPATALRKTAAQFLGLDPELHRESVGRVGMGFVARSWGGSSRGVWLVRVGPSGPLEDWFPLSQRQHQGAMGAAQFFRMPQGHMVAIRDNLAAIGRSWGPGTPFDQVLALMADPGGSALADDPAYQALCRHLPDNALAAVYVTHENGPSAWAGAAGGQMAGFDRAVFALYEKEGTLDLAIRASLPIPDSQPPLTRATLDRLLQLPQTTLFATAFTWDSQRWLSSAAVRLSEDWSRYASLFHALTITAGEEGNEPLRLGPHAIMAWGQDLRSDSAAPPLAFMIECRDGVRVRERINTVVHRVLGLVQVLDAGAGETLRIIEHRHLGVPISHVPLAPFAERSTLRLARFTFTLDPSWTFWNGWLIVSLTRDHLEQILEAQFGILPTLNSVPEARGLRQETTPRSTVTLIQTGLAADVLNRWLGAFQRGEPSLLDPQWWGAPGAAEASGTMRLGIGMRIAQEPGMVEVVDVYPDTPADGLLRPGDLIFALDGDVLSLESPNADLRRQWSGSGVGPHRRLRVLRDDRMLDVELIAPHSADSADLPAVNPAHIVKELAALGRSLEFASYTVSALDKTHYAARLTLRFVPDRVTEAPDGK